MNVLLNTGEFLTAPTAAGIVDLMRRTARLRESTDAHYMDAVAERVLAWCDSDLDTTTADTFLRGMEANGLITILED